MGLISMDAESTHLSARLNDRIPAHRWFLGVPFTPLGLAEAAALIAGRPPRARFEFITTPNAHHTVHCARGDKRFAVAHDAAWLVLNDSRILHLLSRWLFGQDLPVTAGSDLTVELFRNYIRADDRITIIGGTDEVESRLRTDHGIRSVERYNPPMGFIDDPVEVERCVEFIIQHPARYVFLAVGAPQSEVVACRVLERGGAVGTALCVGSSLLFVTGVVRRAPMIIRRLNAEWAYRLMQNPRRHARRVFVDSLPVLWLALKALFGRSHERHA